MSATLNPQGIVAWVKQQYGATVATIRDHQDGCLEVVKIKDGKFMLTVHQRIGETDRFEDCSIELDPKHFVMLGSVAAQEPEAFRWRYRNAITKVWSNWIDGKPHFKPEPGDEIEEQALYAAPVAAQPPVGAVSPFLDSEDRSAECA